MKLPRHPAKLHERVECVVPGYAMGTGTFIEMKAQGNIVRIGVDGRATVAFEYRLPITALQVIEEKPQ